MPGIQVDDNDIFVMYVATKTAIERARRGKGPTLIEAYTYRIGAHTTSDDPTRYRSDDEVEAWKKKDPIDRMKKYLINKEYLKEEKRKRVLATPMARKIAYDLNINISEVVGTDPQGRVMKADIQKEYDERHNKAQDNKKVIVGQIENIGVSLNENTVLGEVERIKFTSLRKTIARNMTKFMYTVPHALCMDEVDVTELVNYREKAKNLFVDDKDIRWRGYSC